MPAYQAHSSHFINRSRLAANRPHIRQYNSGTDHHDKEAMLIIPMVLSSTPLAEVCSSNGKDYRAVLGK